MRIDRLHLLKKIAAIDKVMKLDGLSDDDLRFGQRGFPLARLGS